MNRDVIWRSLQCTFVYNIQYTNSRCEVKGISSHNSVVKVDNGLLVSFTLVGKENLKYFHSVFVTVAI